MGMMTPEDIQTMRLALGLSHEEFAAELGVSANAVYRWELGDRHPKYDLLVKLNELAERARRSKPKKKLSPA